MVGTGSVSYTHLCCQRNSSLTLKLKIPYFNNETIGVERKATVTLTAGRLTHNIEVTQYKIDPGIIKFVEMCIRDRKWTTCHPVPTIKFIR